MQLGAEKAAAARRANKEKQGTVLGVVRVTPNGKRIGRPPNNPAAKAALVRARQVLSEMPEEPATIEMIAAELDAMSKSVQIIAALPPRSRGVVLGYLSHTFKQGVA